MRIEILGGLLGQSSPEAALEESPPMCRDCHTQAAAAPERSAHLTPLNIQTQIKGDSTPGSQRLWPYLLC